MTNKTTDTAKIKNLKIAVANYCGHIGKTTIVNNLLEVNMPGTPVIAVETINDDGGKSEIKFKGKDYGLLQDELLMNESLIVDIGASNIEETMRLMAKYKGSHEEFDYFIIPTVPDQKAQTDTASTIKALLAMGVTPNKIRLVFNKVEDNITSDFDSIIGFANNFKINIPKVGIELNEIYPELRERGITLDQLLDMKDLRDKVRAAENELDKRRLVKLIGLQRLGNTAKDNLSEVFKDLSL
jgi:hypothetical protein